MAGDRDWCHSLPVCDPQTPNLLVAARVVQQLKVSQLPVDELLQGSDSSAGQSERGILDFQMHVGMDFDAESGPGSCNSMVIKSRSMLLFEMQQTVRCGGPVKNNIMLSQNQPQTYFYRGWKDFTVSNDLVIGDRLIFVLVAKSLFHVFILRIGVNPGLSVKTPNLWSHNLLPVQRETTMSPVPLHGCKISAGGSHKSENPLSGTLLAKNTAVERYVAKVASDSPDSSQSPSDMDSRHLEPMVRQIELKMCIESRQQQGRPRSRSEHASTLSRTNNYEQHLGDSHKLFDDELLSTSEMVGAFL